MTIIFLSVFLIRTLEEFLLEAIAAICAAKIDHRP